MVIKKKASRNFRLNHRQIFSELHERFKHPNFVYMGLEESDFYCYTHEENHNLQKCFAMAFIDSRKVQEKISNDGLTAEFFQI